MRNEKLNAERPEIIRVQKQVSNDGLRLIVSVNAVFGEDFSRMDFTISLIRLDVLNGYYAPTSREEGDSAHVFRDAGDSVGGDGSDGRSGDALLFFNDFLCEQMQAALICPVWATGEPWLVCSLSGRFAMLEVRLTEIVGTDRTSLQRFAALNAGAATAQSIFLKWDIQNADDSAVLAAIEIPCHKAG